MFQYLYNDTEGPVIQIESDTITIRVNATEQDVLAGVTAYDSKDGDVTSSLMIESSSNFIAKGERKVTIVAFDEDNNFSTAERTVFYNDYKSPEFSLSQPFSFQTGNTKITNYLTATDLFDGDISKLIQVYNDENSTNLFNASLSGDYKMVFSVVNSAGDVEKFSATVSIYNSELTKDFPAIRLSDYLVYVKKGEEFNPMAYLKSVTVEGVLYEKLEDNIFITNAEKRQLAQGDISYNQIEEFDLTQVSVVNPVDVNVEGFYEVEYSVQDINANKTVTRLIVCVEE